MVLASSTHNIKKLAEHVLYEVKLVISSHCLIDFYTFGHLLCPGLFNYNIFKQSMPDLRSSEACSLLHNQRLYNVNSSRIIWVVVKPHHFLFICAFYFNLSVSYPSAPEYTTHPYGYCYQKEHKHCNGSTRRSLGELNNIYSRRRSHKNRRLSHYRACCGRRISYITSRR